ncbi:MAG: hypothetical protein LBP25_00170 [Tannerellaceae bacterium]|jgi:ABC-type uncharacterized transport system permease subunit|nr:hypothetical protein [Tannerellaceae bacterium]
MSWFAHIHLYLSTGIIYGIAAIGLGLIYKYLKFPDFTTTISFSAGAAMMAFMSQVNINSAPILSVVSALFLSVIIGGILGMITYSQIRYIKINNILAGIITSVGAMSLIYIITNNEALINVNEDSVRSIFNSILKVKFSWQNIIILVIIGLLLTTGIAKIFKTQYGLYILGLLGTDNYIAHRHHNKEKARFLLLVLGNSIISFSGALLTVQNVNFNISGTPDFLIISLSGYVLSSFIIQIFSNTNKPYLQIDIRATHPSVKMSLPLKGIKDILNKNDEEPSKIGSFLFFIIVGTVIINVIFQSIDVTVGNNNKISYLYKASLFLVVMLIGNYERIFSHKK